MGQDAAGEGKRDPIVDDANDSGDGDDGARAEDSPVAAGPRARRPRSAQEAAVRAASSHRHGPGSVTAAAVAGLVLSAVVAAAPSSAVVIIPALVVLVVRRTGSRVRLIAALAPVIATAAPSAWGAWRHVDATGAGWRDALRYLLTDIGVPVAVPLPSTAQLLLGVPVNPEALVPGGAPVAGSTLAVVGVVLLALLPLLALAGLLTRGHLGARARAGILVALGGLALALLSVRHLVGIGQPAGGSGTQLVAGWPGTGLSLALAGMLASALAAGDAVRTALMRHSLGWRHAAVGAATVVVGIVPLALGTAWAVSAARSTGVGPDALIMALRPASTSVPTIAGRMQAGSADARVVVLTSTDAGMTVQVWRGPGVQISDAGPDVLNAQLASRTEGWSDPGLRPGGAPAPAAAHSPAAPMLLADAADASMADAIARAISGQDESAAQTLAAHGVAVVVLTDRDGDTATAQAHAGLDATPGMEELARTPTATSWRVVPGTGEVARVSLRAADGTTVVVPSDGRGAGLDLEADPDERTLLLADRADGGWTATLAGRPLEAVTDPQHPWRQAFTVPAGASGELVVDYVSQAAAWQTRIIWTVWLITALAALPLRRRKAVP